ncbi:hypothetical protein D5086_021571 [Populus alba]|uniref:Uncharacterized protein n=1 Tax=Populus alba TaxID=43335 RepID=A0ACC4BE94_POPAL
MEEGHCTCPKTGQMLMNTRLVPNRALRNLIVQWCAAHGIPYDPPENTDSSVEAFAAAMPSKAAIEANRATATLLIHKLASGSQRAQTVAARGIRLLAKTGRENRAFIAEAGAIPHLPVHDYKKRIADEEGAVEALAGLLRAGTPRGKKDAVTALFNLSTHTENCLSMMEAGAVTALVGALGNEGLQRKQLSLLFTGTKRARRKAASLARVFQRRENYPLHFGGLGAGYAFAGNSAPSRDSSFVNEVSVPVSISVPVL